jgi:hypothetical protein
MSGSTKAIRVSGLTKLDLLEFGDKFPPGSVRLEDQKMPGGKLGEPTTIGIIIVSVAAINALALWLLKTRNTKVIDETIELIDADGTTHRTTLHIDLSSSKAPEAAVIKELARLTKVELGPLSGNVE